MKVAAVLGEHLADQPELLLPDPTGGGGGQAVNGQLQHPQAVVPYPVAFRVLDQQWYDDGQLGADDVEMLLAAFGDGISCVVCNARGLVRKGEAEGYEPLGLVEV